MLPSTKPGEFKDQLTVDYLESTYMDHQQVAQQLALSEIQSLSLAMPRFNTLATLSKTEFNKFLARLKRKCQNSNTFAVMVAAVIDTYTCMIQSNQFYDNYAGDNKSGLDLVMDLLQSVKGLVTYCDGAIDSTQLPILIGMLEKSAGRIQNIEFHNNMLQIIQVIKQTMQARLEAASKPPVHPPPEPRPNTELVGKIWVKSFADFKENCKPSSNNNKRKPTPVTRPDKCVKSSKDTIKPLEKQVAKGICVSRDLNNKNDCTVDGSRSHVVLPFKKRSAVANGTVQTISLDSQTNSKPANAFDLMMKSSKIKFGKKTVKV